jgi:hypothetical protein
MNKEPDGKFVPEQEGGRNDQNQKKGAYHPVLFYAGADLVQTAGEVFGSVTNKFAVNESSKQHISFTL